MLKLELFKLFGSIFVDNEKANESISKTNNKAEELSKKLSEGIKTVAKWGTAIVGGATVVGGAMVGVANKSAQAMDEIDKMSAKIGISKKGYQEWSYVLGQNGMDVNKLQVGVKTLVGQMDKVTEGNKNSIATFEKLGLSVYDSTGKMKDQETMMNEVMYALADMENGTEKSRLATELFGKAGLEMMPMLNGGSEGMKELTARAHELGLVVSDEAVTNGVVFGDTMDDLKQALSMVGTEIGNGLIPYFQKIADWVIANIPVVKEKFAEFQNAVGFVIDKVKGLDDWLKKHETTLQVVAILLGALTTAIVMFNAQTIIETAQIYALIVAEKLHAIATTVSTTATTMFGTAMAFLTSPITLVILAIGSLIAIAVLLAKNWDTVKEKAVVVWDSIKNAIITPLENAKERVWGIVETIKGFFTGMKLSFPNIKMPHFAITPSGWKIGDLLKGKIPKLDVEWYAKAMNDGMILNGATIFGMNNGKLLGGGETGSETVVGTASLLSMIKQVVADTNGNVAQINAKILELLSDENKIHNILVKALTDGNFKVELNGREVGRIVRAYA